MAGNAWRGARFFPPTNGRNSMRRSIPGGIAAVFAVSLAAAPLAFAQSQPQGGTTSGPAAGTNAVPDAAVQKQGGHEPATSTGIPGSAGAKGNENGPPPGH
jgi:hypothetical protein